jgi:rsbT co-antagonist protein RsbR
MDIAAALTADELLRNSPFAAVRLDAGAHVVAWNDRAAALVGLEAAHVGQAAADVLTLAPKEGSWPEFLARPGGSRRISVHRDAEGEPLHCEWWLQPIGQGEALCFGLDVSERVKAERMQFIESTALHAILDNLTIVVWVVDAAGMYVYHEGRGLARVGLRPGQMVGVSVFDVFKGLPALEVLRRGLAGEAAHYPAPTADAEWDNWQVPIFDDAGEVTALVGITLDVTELKRTAQELQAKLDLIDRQQRAIRELSTPIIEVWDRILTLPIVGLVDSTRTAEIMENLLQAVVRYRARYAILDLTGVDVVDTSTASHILGLIRTIRLLGAEGILTGIHPSIAQTIVTLGVDLSGLIVRSTLREALQHCIVQMAKRPAPKE